MSATSSISDSSWQPSLRRLANEIVDAVLAPDDPDAEDFDALDPISACRLILSQPDASGWHSECERRLEILLQAEADPEFREQQRRQCAADPVYFINSYGWTFDPRAEADKFRPFVLWPIQEAFVRAIQESLAEADDLACEKSRETGATWTAACFSGWGFLFEKGFKATFGSRKESYVDSSENPDSIFEKIRLFLRMLPWWLMPRKWDWNKNSRQLRLSNRQMRSTITGEGGTNMGRGGRATLYVLDEAAFVEQPELIENALTSVARTRLDISTPNGMGNPFQVKVAGGKVRVVRIHWKDDPRKNGWIVYTAGGDVWATGNGDCEVHIPRGGRLAYPWRDREIEKIGDIRFAQEYDIDYAASLEGLLVPALWVKAAVDLHKRHPEVFDVSLRFSMLAGLDVADEGANLNAFVPRRGPVVFSPKTWKIGGPTDTANAATAHARSLGVVGILADAIGVGSGVVSTWVAQMRGRLKLPFRFAGIKWGGRATDALWPDRMRSTDKFRDLKAELHWIVRRRFERTFEFVENGVEHDWTELISIPNDPEFIRQCSLVRWFTTETGKIVIESKKELADRGVKSPDLWDAFVLSFAPLPKPARPGAAGGKRESVKVR